MGNGLDEFGPPVSLIISASVLFGADREAVGEFFDWSGKGPIILCGN